MTASLNIAQRAAVETLRGPLLVLAGAGTGKTRVVTHRIAELIRRGTPAERICAVTFTKKAATEMQQRATSLLGKRLPQRPEISTFHSLCVRILRRQIQLLGYPPQFAIYDRSDQESLARTALREMKVPNAALRPGDLLAKISRWKTSSIRPEQAARLANSDQEHLAAAAYRRYQRALKLSGAVDFDDLLLCTEELFLSHPAALAAEAGRFDHLLIDEYQDTNGSQYRIVKALAGGHRNLCVVGDDDQSIYGWRGAEVTHILQFKRDWPDAKIVRLEANYRSTAEILELANRLIAHNRTRHAKTLRASATGGELPRILQYPDETTEAKTVVDDIAQQIRDKKALPRDFAILFRTNEQPRAFEQELRQARLPYVLVGGQSFFDRKEVRDVLAYLKLLVQPQDEIALLRIINTPPRGVGAGAVERIQALAVSQGRPAPDVLDTAKLREQLPAAANAGLTQLTEVLSRHRAMLKTHLPDAVAASLVQAIDYQAEIRRAYAEEQEQSTRWNSVGEVLNALAAYVARKQQPQLREFLDDFLLSEREDADDKEKQLQRDAIALMTLHSAKGLEFPQVYLVGLEEGLLPHHRALGEDDSAIEEERRLCYVGVTRAQKRLTLSLSLTRFKWGQPRPTIPSRFLWELRGTADSPQARAALEQAAALASGGTGRKPASAKQVREGKKPSPSVGPDLRKRSASRRTSQR